jgi:hypothetical protein
MLVDLTAKSSNSLGNFVNIADPEAQVGKAEPVERSATALPLGLGCTKSEQLDTLSVRAAQELRPELDVLELHQPRKRVTDIVGVRGDEP